jgi:nicotinamide mononucleotide adenylyltransferase
MTTVVIMPGGFHPYHAGHHALYQSAQRTFPDAEVFVAATNDTSSRPFPFAVKEKLAKLAGVEAGHFVQVKSPFRAEEITSKFDPQKDVLIFVRSEKDANTPPQAGGVKKDGSPSYLQPLLDAKKLEPFSKHAYMAYLPTVEFGPGMTSATQIRSAWPSLDERRKTALVMSLYPKTQTSPKLAQTVVKLLDAAIGGEQGVEETSISTQVSLPKWQIGLPVFVKHLGQKGEIASLGNDSAIVDVGMRQYRVPLDGLKRYPSRGVTEDANRAEAQADYMEGQCMILAVAINQYNPKRYPIGYIWEYNMSAGAPDMQMDDDEWNDLSPEEQQEISNDISRHSVVHAYVRDQETNEYIDARGRHKTLPNLWGRMGQTRFDEFPGTARELINITAHGDWDEVGDRVNFKRGQPAFDSLAGPAGVKKALDYAVKYLGVVGPEQAKSPNVPQGVELVDLDTDVDQNIYTLTVDGETVSFTYWDSENNFENPNINDIYQQAKEQLGKKLSPENVKEIARAVFKSFQQGMTEGAPIVVAQAPIDVRNPKKAPQPYRNQGDIVPDTKSPSTEKRGVKGRPGQRPMPDYTKDVDENQGWAATFTNEDDYIEEKWSSKYKSSINCAAPRGFSQRAHCAGRKK